MKKPTPVQTFHLSRLMLFLVLGVAFFVAQSSSSNALQLTYDKQAVLAYATNMSISDLLSATNQARVSNGLAPLSLNAQLNSSAQMKANDMTANNYWAHVSPSGIQPWYWFAQAGYSYSAAGENLAYGFNTGAEVNAAWMNSASHRENVLGDYVDVGFGIANSATFQGTENTVVVAHYGKPQQTTPTPTPVVTTTPTATPTPTPTAVATPTPTKTTPATTPAVTESPTTPATTTPQTSETPATPVTQPAAAQPATNTTDTSKAISVFDQLRSGKASLTIMISIGLVGLAVTGFVLTHRAFMRHLVENGRKFMVHHPILDILIVSVSLAAILTTTVGHLL